MLHPIDFTKIEIKGELAVRSGRNYARLEGKWYRPDEVFRADSHGWPADWEGRILLALVLLSQSTHRTAAYLDEILSMMPEYFNEKGYFGPVLPEGHFDEQQFGGHSWMFRALAEYEKWKPGKGGGKLLEQMVRNFLLPASGYYSQYPIDPGTRFEHQDVWTLSKLQTKTKHHAETSDAGCAFIMLDGATAAYELLKWPELKKLVLEMEARFLEMDLQALHIQTHATLSAVRGLIRFYETTGEKEHLLSAESVYRLYRDTAMTEAYGNYNWFGVPRWTEPCAIIDSFLVTVNLWKHLQKEEYLEDAHLIYFNAFCHGNRENGSFGTDSCVGAKDAEEPLMLYPVNFETYWCCTMRGGEGFSRAIEFCVFQEGNTAWFPFYHSASIRLGSSADELWLEEKSGYPYRDNVTFDIIRSCEKEWELRFFVPDWCSGAELSWNGRLLALKKEGGFLSIKGCFKQGDRLELKLPLALRREEVVRTNNLAGCHKYFFGPMLLGAPVGTEVNSLEGNRFENYAESHYKADSTLTLPPNPVWENQGNGRFCENATGILLEPLCDVKNMTKEDHMHQVLFYET